MDVSSSYASESAIVFALPSPLGVETTLTTLVTPSYILPFSSVPYTTIVPVPVTWDTTFYDPEIGTSTSIYAVDILSITVVVPASTETLTTAKTSTTLMISALPSSGATFQSTTATYTTNGTAATSNSTSAYTPNNAFSSGDMAGVGIGCAVAAGLLVGLAWFLVSCLRKRRTQRGSTLQSPLPLSARRSANKGDYQLDDLPQETTHDEFRRDFSRLETALKSWALDYFSNSSLQLRAIDEEALLALLGARGTTDRSVFSWLEHIRRSKNATVFVRAYVARVLLDRIDANGDLDDSLLPVQLVRSYQDMLQKTSQSIDPYRLPKEVHHWRAITVSLLSQQKPGNRATLHEDHLKALSDIRKEVLSVLAPLRNTRPQERCEEKLNTIIRDVVSFGLKIFGETSPLLMQWSSSSSRQDALFPELKQYRLDTQDTLTVSAPVME